MGNKGEHRQIPFQDFQYPIIPDLLNIRYQYPYTIRSDQKYLFQYLIHFRPEVKKPYPSDPGQDQTQTYLNMVRQYMLHFLSLLAYLWKFQAFFFPIYLWQELQCTIEGGKTYHPIQLDTLLHFTGNMGLPWKMRAILSELPHISFYFWPKLIF